MSEAKSKLTVTVGEDTPHGRLGITVIDGEFPVTVTWRLTVTNCRTEYDADHDMYDDLYSDRFIANPPKKVLGKLYTRIRDAAITANRVQELAEAVARHRAENITSLLRTNQQELDNETAQATADGVTIMLNQGDIDTAKRKAEEPNVAIADVLGIPSEDDGLSKEEILGGGQQP